jgi:CBS domain-containing protein
LHISLSHAHTVKRVVLTSVVRRALIPAFAMRKEPTMSTVQDLLSEKGVKVHSIDPGTTVLDATQRMNQYKIGALVAMHDGQVVGMFTERDVLRRVVAEQRDPATAMVGEVMTTEVVCVTPATDLDEVGAVMQSKRIRHVPVCDDDGRLLGMVSIGDLNAWRSTNQQATIHYLNEYIYGRV